MLQLAESAVAQDMLNGPRPPKKTHARCHYNPSPGHPRTAHHAVVRGSGVLQVRCLRAVEGRQGNVSRRRVALILSRACAAMNPILKKLQFKGQSPALVLAAPLSSRPRRRHLKSPVHSAANGKYPFVLGFAKSQAEATAHAKAAKKILADEFGFIAFGSPTPKGFFQEVSG